MLEAIGFTKEEEAVYRAVIARQRASVAELAAASGASKVVTARILRTFETKGLVVRTVGSVNTYAAVSPDVALEALILGRSHELDTVRNAIPDLMAEFDRERDADDPAALIELVSGTEASRQQSIQLQRAARREVRVLDRPPYVAEVSPPQENPLEVERLAEGIRCRGVYDRSGLELPGRLDAVREVISLGEEARVTPTVPIKLLLVDDTVGLVLLDGRPDRVTGSLLVHPCALLTMLSNLFEDTWSRAVPLTSNGTSEPVTDQMLSGSEREILALMISGATDVRLARHLNTSTRTTRRRVNDLMHRLGAETRAQLAYLAGKEGWV